MRLQTIAALAAGVLTLFLLLPANAARKSTVTIRALLKDGQQVEGSPDSDRITLTIEGRSRTLPLKEVLSVQFGAPAGSEETARITADLAAVQGTDHKAREMAVAELTDIGLPVLSPLLAAYKDTDLHEPNPLYHLCARLLPGYADMPDRTLDYARLANGEGLRGKITLADLKLTLSDGSERAIPAAGLRCLAVRRTEITKTFMVEALRHCTQIEFLDTGVAVTPASKLDATAQGFVRLSFDIDGWASDPDGIKKPGPNYKTIYVDGFPFGALVGRIGPAGARWLAGRHVQKNTTETGRLYFAVNDNGHWQNNIGSFRVKLRVTNAYDLGDPQ